MQMERQLRAGGGIMTLDEPRQGYFLGKLVKKAKRAVKKVVKSPIGKAALLGAIGFGIPGTQIGGLFGRAAFGGAAPSIFGQSGGIGALLGQGGKFSTLGDLFRVGGKAGEKLSIPRLLGGGLGAAAIAAPFFMGGDEEEVEEETPFTQTPDSIANIVEQARNQDPSLRFLPKPKFVDNFYAADGGLADVPRMPMQEGGIMDLGGMEKDYRTGGFVELGAEERADDVPARLSKNEFVFTADAVRNAGGGDIDRGAEVMQNMMDNLEAGGMISEESQGMNPAQEMFDQSQMLEGRLA
jgi:hypothetical protein